MGNILKYLGAAVHASAPPAKGKKGDVKMEVGTPTIQKAPQMGVEIGTPRIENQQPQYALQVGTPTIQQVPTPSQMPLGEALRTTSVAQAQPGPGGAPTAPQGPVDVPFRDFFALVKGDPEKAEALIPGITDPANITKLLKPGPDGTPHVNVNPQDLAQMARIAHQKVAPRQPAQQAPAPMAGQPAPGTMAVLQAAGMSPQDLTGPRQAPAPVTPGMV